MIDSTNPRIMADNIRELASASGGTSVVANPEGSSTEALTKVLIDNVVYGIGEGIKAGQATLSGGDSYATITTAISFQSPMPDTNYAVTLTQATADSEGPMYVRMRVVSKTVNGFSVECYSNETVRAFKVDWIAVPYEPVPAASKKTRKK